MTEIKEIIEYLNLKTGSSFKHTTEQTVKHIKARLKDGFTVEDFKDVIDNRCEKWGKDDRMSEYLRPNTLFAGKFEGYLQEARKRKSINNDLEMLLGFNQEV